MGPDGRMHGGQYGAQVIGENMVFPGQPVGLQHPQYSNKYQPPPGSRPQLIGPPGAHPPANFGGPIGAYQHPLPPGGPPMQPG